MEIGGFEFMARKTEEERLKELDEQMEKIKARKQKIESQLRTKERKERTRRLIQLGAIFESYFGKGLDEEEAEKIAFAVKDHVRNNKVKIAKIDIEKSKEAESKGLKYPVFEEKAIVPDNKSEGHKAK